MAGGTGRQEKTDDSGKTGDSAKGRSYPSSLFINRELSWLEFNRRVLSEACAPVHPLIERIKFVSIFSNNLDEFFMIRVAGLQRQLERGVREPPPDGMSPQDQLAEIHRILEPMLAQQSDLWGKELIPALQEAGIHIVSCGDLLPGDRAALRDYFQREVFPVLTPLALDPSHPFPFISNLSLNLAVILNYSPRGKDNFARVKVPTDLFPRLIRVPDQARERVPKDGIRMVFLEDLIAENLDLLFPGCIVRGAYPFRITRDADLEIEEDEASDLLTAVEE
ncbi:MAG TPA: RNA degradosome polyphosphate kinase, partial [Methanoregulaceae archaeon]|nr:RNA degradosome polyphosphate kinase [Methanoregulaceae archaeon]